VVRALGVIPLAMRSDAALPHAVRLHAAIGSETRIAWLLDRLAECDSRDAWDRVAGESLTLELLEVQRRLTAALIESDCLEAFRSANAATLRQIGDTTAQIESEERKGLAPLAVLAQLIRRLS
jgi:NAD-specific glutamate dehydrogenase